MCVNEVFRPSTVLPLAAGDFFNLWQHPLRVKAFRVVPHVDEAVTLHYVPRLDLGCLRNCTLNIAIIIIIIIICITNSSYLPS